MAIVEEFFEILHQIHDKDCLHAGSKKTFSRVYSYVIMHGCASHLYLIFAGTIIILISTKKCG